MNDSSAIQGLAQVLHSLARAVADKLCCQLKTGVLEIEPLLRENKLSAYVPCNLTRTTFRRGFHTPFLDTYLKIGYPVQPLNFPCKPLTVVYRFGEASK